MRFVTLLLILVVRSACSAQDASRSNAPILSNQITNALGEIPVNRFKKQALQSVSVTSGFLADTGDDRLNSQFLDVSIGSGIPLGSFDNLLGIKPRFRVDWIDAAEAIDVPKELYQFELQFFYRRVIGERLSAMLVFSPSIRSDLSTSDDALRVFALGLINWKAIPERLTLSAGAVYLGRADLPVVPAIGLTWTPNTKTRFELRFPTTKFARRIGKNGGQSETWAYSSIGLGGNTWAVTRRSNETDELSLRDFRLLMGVERIVEGGGGWLIEGGYAFGRRIEFENDESELDLDDALLLRAGWRY